jgi:hypothetical protein
MEDRMVNWPDFMLPPINLWNVPWQRFKNRVPAKGNTPEARTAPVDKVATMQRLLQGR